MELLSNRKNLLLIMAALASIRFIIVPLFDWQGQQVDEMRSLQSRLDKGQYLVSQSGYLAEVKQKLELAVSKQQAIFFDASNKNNTQLKQLQKIEKLIADNNLKVRNSRWLGQQDHDAYVEYRLEIGITGDLADFIQFTAAVELLPNPRRFAQWQVNISGMSKTSIGRLTNAKAVIQFLVAKDEQQGAE
ncbi:hypothetical protein FM038_015570 [Shewanella eurypsychrophilus]|uniref:Uncharacterized protein n=1 Tax=Shewanella eurypsychrophilus TaxID=2593656 RepID=A0ABX6V7Q0_9GAMM|nr:MULTISPECIES: hypothetical protein [Shewanella]QFU23448.1 hypothetical protein FS418_17380 [Shewanella sp. YLB-09]QPG58677.1 hypothetical protein FM038_015570 [Shewanella eurypsychrophilus]